MRKIFLAAAAVLLAGAANADIYATAWVSAPTDARREFRPGITGQWMTLDAPVDFLDNIAAKASVGYSFDIGARVEADLLRLGLRDRRGGSNSFNANFGVESVRVLYDLRNCTFLAPYLGVGIYGFDFRDGDLKAYDFSGVLGMSAKIYEGLSLDFQYERNWYLNPDYKISVPGIGPVYGTVKNGLNLWKLGLRYEF
ncbi:MAG: outer membrane beta-barrel protein [Rickettsiales bacterium]|jgi:hypothetical protein|nr:outer membrane beta-barrel protein [Rickettsiales bacterium]